MSSIESIEEVKRKRMQYLLDFIKDNKNCRILDVGCQSGDLCHELSRIGHEVYGVDVVEEEIAEARKKFPQINFECADVQKELPFANNFFDIVWAGEIIEHMHFTDVFVNEMNRVLKIGGLFVLSTPMHNRLKNVLISLYRFEKHFDPEFPHLRFYTLKSLKSVLEKRGFNIEKVKYFGRIKPLANSMFIISRKREDKMVMSQYRF